MVITAAACGVPNGGDARFDRRKGGHLM